MAQTLAWASSYYLPVAIGHGVGMSVSAVFCAFSIAAGAGQWAGRAIACLGGKPVLLVSNLQFSASWR